MGVTAQLTTRGVPQNMKMPPSFSSPIFVLSLLLLLLGAVATQSEVSTPFFEEDAQLSVSPDTPPRPSPFDEAVQPKQNEDTQAHPMPETIGVSPLVSWSSWLRTIFTNAFGLNPAFDLNPPMAAVRPAAGANVAGKLAILATNTSGKCILKPNAPSGYKQVCSSALSSNQCDVYAMTCVWSPDSCQLKSGSPVGYKPLCEGAKDAAACAALSLTCAWGQPPLKCSGSLIGSECLAWQAFYDTTGGGGCSRDDPCKCVTTYGAVECQDGHITSMNLYGTGISGSISDSISALTALTSLELSHTSISGSIPDSISALTALTQLALDRTSISGSIPQSFCSFDLWGGGRFCGLSNEGSPTYACPLPSCGDKLKACGVTSCQ